MLTSFIRPDAPLVGTKSDTELQYCIDNREKYCPESVLAAVSELQRRGVEFSEEEERIIGDDMNARVEIAEEAGNVFGGIFSGAYKQCLVEDPDAYEFYSRKIIKVFTFLFNPLFGSILMAMNVSKTGNTPGVFFLLLFGAGITAVEIITQNLLNLNIGATLFFSFINAYLIDLLFWNNYIGKATLYRARSYQTPLTLAIIICLLTVVLIVFNRNSTHAMDTFISNGQTK